MPMIVDAVYENGVLRSLAGLDLPERQQVRVTVEVAPYMAATPPGSDDDPLADIRIATGLGDSAEHFDDYRFGRRR
jgi:predicted DNA-binding antitoxin AbrB/MazE fold protein